MLSPHQNQYYSSPQVIKSLEAKYKARRTLSERVADWTVYHFGSTAFLLTNILFFCFWILINIGALPFIEPFDPFPFILLTTTVSLEAIILSVSVLISQNRAAKIDDLREEVDLQVDTIAESELTKLIKLTTLLLEKHGIDVSGDKELGQMLKPINENKIEKSLEKQI